MSHDGSLVRQELVRFEQFFRAIIQECQFTCIFWARYYAFKHCDQVSWGWDENWL